MFNLVNVEAGEFCIVLPPIITTYRLFCTSYTTFNSNAYSPGETSKTVETLNINSDYVLSLQNLSVNWTMNFGRGTTTTTLQDVITSGFKVYKKN